MAVSLAREGGGSIQAADPEPDRRRQLAYETHDSHRRRDPLAEPFRDPRLLGFELPVAEQLELDRRRIRRPNDARLEAMPALPLQPVVHDELVARPFDPPHVPDPAAQHDARLDRLLARVAQAHLRERAAAEG